MNKYKKWSFLSYTKNFSFKNWKPNIWEIAKYKIKTRQTVREKVIKSKNGKHFSQNWKRNNSKRFIATGNVAAYRSWGPIVQSRGELQQYKITTTTTASPENELQRLAEYIFMIL